MAKKLTYWDLRLEKLEMLRIACTPSFLEIAPKPFSNEEHWHYLNQIHQQSNRINQSNK